MLDKKPTLLLLGDSISLGYRDFVRENLRGSMEVYYPPENGKFAAYTFRMISNWAQNFPANIDWIYRKIGEKTPASKR